MHERRNYKAHPVCRWRTSLSRARSSRVCHTSYPVPVRRPAPSDCRRSRTLSGRLPCLRQASFRPRLATAPPDQVRGRLLPFLLASGELLAFGSAKTWRGDFHPTSPVPCPAHTMRIRRGYLPSLASGLLDAFSPSSYIGLGTECLGSFAVHRHREFETPHKLEMVVVQKTLHFFHTMAIHP